MSGCYRSLMLRPKDFQYKISYYTDPFEPLVLSDFDVIRNHLKKFAKQNKETKKDSLSTGLEEHGINAAQQMATGDEDNSNVKVPDEMTDGTGQTDANGVKTEDAKLVSIKIETKTHTPQESLHTTDAFDQNAEQKQTGKATITDSTNEESIVDSCTTKIGKTL